MSDGLSPAQRILRARLGGLTTAARGHVTTEAARAKFLERFVPVDPGLSPAERLRRAEAARRLYFTRLALKSSRVRGRKMAARATDLPQAAVESADAAATPG